MHRCLHEAGQRMGTRPSASNTTPRCVSILIVAIPGAARRWRSPGTTEQWDIGMCTEAVTADEFQRLSSPPFHMR
eukprot:Skav212815  [mRNA]  locus=scaffold4580:26578:26802:- [translate_table: standard]